MAGSVPPPPSAPPAVLGSQHADANGTDPEDPFNRSDPLFNGSDPLLNRSDPLFNGSDPLLNGAEPRGARPAAGVLPVAPVPVICGWLLKRGAAASTAFRRRWCVLTTGGNILYAAAEPAYTVEGVAPDDPALLARHSWSGCVHLTAHSAVVDTSLCPVTSTQHRANGRAGLQSPTQMQVQGLQDAWRSVACSFLIRSKSESRVWFLSAESPELRELWVARINEILAHMRRVSRFYQLRILAVQQRAVVHTAAPTPRAAFPAADAAAAAVAANSFLDEEAGKNRHLSVICAVDRTEGARALAPLAVLDSPCLAVTPASAAGPARLSFDTGLVPPPSVAVHGLLCGHTASISLTVKRHKASLVEKFFTGVPAIAGSTGAVRINNPEQPLPDNVESVLALPVFRTTAGPEDTPMPLGCEILIGATPLPDPLAQHSINVRVEYGTTQDYLLERRRILTPDPESGLVHQTFVRLAHGTHAQPAPPLLQVAAYRPSVATNNCAIVEVMDEFRNVLLCFCRLKTGQLCSEWFICRGGFGGLRIATLVEGCDEDEDDDDDDDDDADAVVHMLSNPLEADETQLHGSTIEICHTASKVTLTRCIQLAGLGVPSLIGASVADRRHEEVEIAVLTEQLGSPARMTVAPQEDMAFLLAIEEGFKHCVKCC